MTMTELYIAIIVGFILSFLLLPFPDCMTRCLRVRLVVERSPASEEYEKIISAKKAAEAD